MGMKFNEIPRRYLSIQFAIWIILLVISFAIFFVSTIDFKEIWFFIMLPIFWIFSYSFISQAFHVYWRILGKFLFISILILAIILVSFTYLMNYAVPENILYGASIWWMFAFYAGLFLGYFLSIIITKRTMLEENVIEDNSVVFSLSGLHNEKIATRDLMLKTIRKYLGYRKIKRVGENAYLFRSMPVNNNDLIIKWDDDKIGFFPFLNDGNYFAPCHELLASIKVIGKSMMGLEFAPEIHKRFLISDFNSYATPSRILSGLKSFGRGFTLRDIFGIAVFAVILCLLVYYTSTPNAFIEMGNIFYWVAALLISIVGALIGNKIYEKYLAKK